MSVAIVVPTVGRPSLLALLDSLAAAGGPRPDRIVVVDDRPASPEPLGLPERLPTGEPVELRHSAGSGPAAARNVGWRDGAEDWVAFLDDDVLVGESWLADLHDDLAAAGPDVAAVSGRIVVPPPAHRRPTDWERGTAGLADARWITADIAYRRTALAAVGGFDERFPRAFREDADLALRVQDRGWRLVRGRRTTRHPVRPARWDASIRQQRGNADDVLMSRLHGRDWYARAEAPVGRRPAHLAVTAALLTGLGAALSGHRRAAAAALGAWAAGTAQFAWARIAPGPRDLPELTRMAVTSAAIPPVASAHWLAGLLRHRDVRPWGPPTRAVLFDRDGTLVHDVPYNGDPAQVRPVAGAREAVALLRAAGIATGVVTNQSGVARGLIRRGEVEAVNRCVDELIGPFDTWQVCPHDDADDCGCRKPAPGMVLAAAAELGVPVAECAVVGDTAADVRAALQAGAGAGVLVPNGATRREEVEQWPRCAPDLLTAVRGLLAGGGGAGHGEGPR